MAADSTDGRREAWVKTIPESFSPEEGVKLAEAAIREARGSVRAVKMEWAARGGTLPPPPWPAPPELVKAIEDMERIRDGFEVFARRVPNARWPKNMGKVGPATIRTGTRLYDELGRFEGDAARVRGNTLKDILKVFPDPRRLIAGLPPWLVVAGVVAWIERRRLRRLFG